MVAHEVNRPTPMDSKISTSWHHSISGASTDTTSYPTAEHLCEVLSYGVNFLHFTCVACSYLSHEAFAHLLHTISTSTLYNDLHVKDPLGTSPFGLAFQALFNHNDLTEDFKEQTPYFESLNQHHILPSLGELASILFLNHHATDHFRYKGEDALSFIELAIQSSLITGVDWLLPLQYDRCIITDRSEALLKMTDLLGTFTHPKSMAKFEQIILSQITTPVKSDSLLMRL